MFKSSFLPIGAFLMITVLLFSCKTDTSTTKIPSKREGINEVVVRLDAQPKKLNPLLGGTTSSSHIEGHLFDYLLVFDEKDLSMKPRLAVSKPEVEAIEDGEYKGGVQYTYDIHETATWDNGSPITSKDVLFTLKAIQNPLVNAQALRSYMGFFKAIKIDPDNPKKVRIIADKKYVLGEEASALIVLPAYHYDSLGVMEKYTLKELMDPAQTERLKGEADLQSYASSFNDASNNTKPEKIVGSGPYRVTKWVSNQEIILEKKENWWGDKVDYLEAHPDKIIYRFIPEVTTSVTLLKDEGLDVMANIPALDYDVMKSDERMSGLYDFFTSVNYSYVFAGLNNKGAILQDKKVRQALAHLMNVDELVQTLEGGYAERTVGPVHPRKSYYNKGLKPIPFDLAKAQTLLAEAGWKDTDGDGILDKTIDGKLSPLSLTFLHQVGKEVRKNTALLFQENLKKAGIKLEVKSLELNTMLGKVFTRDYDIVLLNWGQAPGLNDFYQIWHSDNDVANGYNIISFRNEEADRLIEEIRITTDKEKLADLYKAFQELVYEEQPYIFLYNPLNKIAIHKRFNAEASELRPGYFENLFQLKK